MLFFYPIYYPNTVPNLEAPLAPSGKLQPTEDGGLRCPGLSWAFSGGDDGHG